MSNEVEESKKALRRELLNRVRGLQHRRPELDEALSSRLRSLPEFTNTSSIMAFAPLPSEPQIDLVVDAWFESHRFVLLPKVESTPGTMVPVLLDRILAELDRDALGIRTPAGPTWNEKIDLILLPGCGFDEHLQRLGRGGGYYDRFLADQPDAIKVGICFECQLIDRLPNEPHDQSVDLLITEERVLGR